MSMNEILEMRKKEEEESKLRVLQEEQKKLKKEIMGMKKKEVEEKKEKVLSALEAQRAKYLEKKKGQQKLNEFDIIGKLNQFTSQLRKTETSMGKNLLQPVKESKKEEEAPSTTEEEKKINPGSNLYSCNK